MKYREFIKRVQYNSGFSDSEAEHATQVFMETLVARLSDDEIKDLCSQLPAEIAVMAEGGSEGVEKFSGSEFLERIAAEQNIDPVHARKQMVAVWETLKEAVSAGEINLLKAQMPNDLAGMLY
jgi:uncharacterized protein (DUF2267 family)